MDSTIIICASAIPLSVPLDTVEILPESCCSAKIATTRTLSVIDFSMIQFHGIQTTRAWKRGSSQALGKESITKSKELWAAAVNLERVPVHPLRQFYVCSFSNHGTSRHHSLFCLVEEKKEGSNANQNENEVNKEYTKPISLMQGQWFYAFVWIHSSLHHFRNLSWMWKKDFSLDIIQAWPVCCKTKSCCKNEELFQKLHSTFSFKMIQ